MNITRRDFVKATTATAATVAVSKLQTTEAVAVKAELFGEYTVDGVSAKTGLQMLADSCKDYNAETAAKVCGIDAALDQADGVRVKQR